MTFDAHARFRPTPGVHARQFERELVILNLSAGLYFGLDEVGAAIWERLVAGGSLDEIADVLVREYEVERGTVETDIGALVASLVERGLIVRAP